MSTSFLQVVYDWPWSPYLITPLVLFGLTYLVRSIRKASQPTLSAKAKSNFSRSYKEARTKFISMVMKSIDATPDAIAAVDSLQKDKGHSFVSLHSIVLNGKKGSLNEELATDIAWIGMIVSLTVSAQL
jgi:hypothetical protein